MTNLLLSRKAEADLEGIWSYSEDRWGEGQAEAYLGRLNEAIQTLANDPAKGVACDRIRPGYRRYRCGSHIIFFHLRGATVRIVRVLHERMDFPRYL